MTHQDADHYAAKHPPGTRLDPDMEAALKSKISDGRITCAAAHKIAQELNVSPAQVGQGLDLLEARISRCQLGLYGYSPNKSIVQPAAKVAPELRTAIESALVNRKITCAACWQIADQAGLARLKLAEACETLQIKIFTCQLGAFQ